MQVSLYQLFLVNDHVVTQIVETKLVIGYIGNVTVISGTALVTRAAVQYHAHGQTQSLMNLAHPLGITVCQIVVDRDNVDTLAFQCVQVCRESRHQGLTFTGLHLGDTSLMEDNTTDELYPIMLHAKHSFRSLADCRKSLYQ